jgi:hypothetical protein
MDLYLISMKKRKEKGFEFEIVNINICEGNLEKYCISL